MKDVSGDAVPGVSRLELDVRAHDALSLAMRSVRPAAIYHLAGISFPPDAERTAAETFQVNVVGTVNLLESALSARRSGQADPVILVVGSGTQYGAHPDFEQPLAEDAPQRPLTIYAASKAAQEVAALQAYRAHGLRVVCTRSFNHSGTGHGQQYILPSLVRRALEMRSSGDRIFRIGNDTVRDYLHVRDAADAYIALVGSGEPGSVYNVCSGKGIRVSELARDVLLRLGLDADISVEPSLTRTADASMLVGSPARLIAATGWAPCHTHIDIIDDLINAATQ
jgi:GDP-4-dehydro-6-deoxy-D-mannose reductase